MPRSRTGALSYIKVELLLMQCNGHEGGDRIIMKRKNQILIGAALLLTFFMTSCAAIPKAAVSLSQTMGSDIVALQKSHRATVDLLFERIEGDINRFVDEVYAPYVINYVLKEEMEAYENGDVSLYRTLIDAGKNATKEATSEAVQVMLEFTEAANAEVNGKREELLAPVLEQKHMLLRSIEESYANVIAANATLTAYLTSARKLKESRAGVYDQIGLECVEDWTTNQLVGLSDNLDRLIAAGNRIDVKSEEAKVQIDNLISNIKSLTNNIKEYEK